jgi:hypothetical protein
MPGAAPAWRCQHWPPSVAVIQVKGWTVPSGVMCCSLRAPVTVKLGPSVSARPRAEYRATGSPEQWPGPSGPKVPMMTPPPAGRAARRVAR